MDDIALTIIVGACALVGACWLVAWGVKMLGAIVRLVGGM